MFQQTVLCHTTSPSKRREKGEQEMWKTSLQSKLFIEIVKIGRYFMYGDMYCTNLTHFTWIRCLIVDGLLFPPFQALLLLLYFVTYSYYCVSMLPCYLVTLLLCYHVTLLPCYLVTLLQYNTIQCSLFWEGRYMINPVKSFLTHGPL